MAHSNPKVSIVVPVHNTAPYLRACVASLTSQTLSDIEIILVENCSTDNSADLCREIAATDSRIKFIQIEKADLSSARNAGIRVASGEYLAFVDSDDTVLPEMCEEVYTAAKENGLTILSFNYLKKYPDGKTKYYFSQDEMLLIVSPQAATSMLLRGKIPVMVWTLLFHRSLFDKMMFPENLIHEDRASTFLYVAESAKVGILNKALYVYFQRKNSIVHSKNDIKKLRDGIKTDIIRFNFIANSPMFPSDEEKAAVSAKSANHLISRLTYMYFLAKTAEEKKEYKSLLSTLKLIPANTRLNLKQRLFLAFLKTT